jgi:hypothetical protein
MDAEYIPLRLMDRDRARVNGLVHPGAARSAGLVANAQPIRGGPRDPRRVRLRLKPFDVRACVTGGSCEKQQNTCDARPNPHRVALPPRYVWRRMELG